MKKTLASASLALLLIVGVSACGAGNDGADTTCGAFNDMDSDGKTETIKKIFKDKGESSPDSMSVTLYKASAQAYCMLKDSDSKLSGMDGN